MLTLFFVSAFAGAGLAAPQEVTMDFADGAQRDAWLRDPVIGDVSFDTFVHDAQNPVCRGAAPYEWPVNGFLFEDPASGNRYLYAGEYCRDYALDADAPSRCVVYRSTDRGGKWERLEPIFSGAPHLFAGEVSPLSHFPDVSVTFADGRYHLCFDWTTENTTWANAANPPPEANSGVGYAWSDRPEGPFHPAPDPIATTRAQVPLLGKYRRLYASTLIRRDNDWLVLTLTDSGRHYGWALLGMTSSKPEGPYSAPQLLLHPECDQFYPPLLEFFPAFVHEGFVYAPATSVALNRNYQALFRVPVEEALNPSAWKLIQRGSLWHAEPLEHEACGIWGQTISGFVGKDGVFEVMFPSRDSQGMGTLNLAHRPWSTPFADRGFVLSGHQGPSMAVAKWGGSLSHLEARLQWTGELTFLWNMRGPLGPNRPTSNATLHPLTLTRYTGVKLGAADWSVLNVDEHGTPDILASGDLSSQGPVSIALDWTAEGGASLRVQGKIVWSGNLGPAQGPFAILAGPHSHARVEQFVLRGHPAPARISYLYTEALLGAAQSLDDWEERESPDFRYGAGAVTRTANARAKWNFESTGITVWCPKGPEYGTAQFRLDGRPAGALDCRAANSEASAPLFHLDGLAPGPHALILIPQEGRVPLDSIEVELADQ